MKDYNYKFNKDGQLKYKIIAGDKNKGIIFVENLIIFSTVLSVLGGVLFFLMRGAIWKIFSDLLKQLIQMSLISLMTKS